MGGRMYLGNQMVTPVIVAGGCAINPLTINPSTSQQTITASGGVDGYSPITVNAVTSSIDPDIQAGNIKSGVNILGINGSVVELNADTLNVTPSTSAQTITPTSPKNAFNEVNVSAVTSSIDDNITAGNIKSGVSILGVTGTYAGGGGSSKYGCTIDNLLGDVNSSGVLQQPTNTSGDIVFTGIEDVGNYALAYKFYSNTNLSNGVSFPDLTTISGAYGCTNVFYGCTNLTSISLPKLSTISGSYGCYFMFYGCTGLTSVSLPELTTISPSNGAAGMFGGCSYLTNISIPKLSTATGMMALYGFVQYCNRLTSISFPLLSNINGMNTFMASFMGCQSLSDIYFNSLTTTSFGSNTSQFNTMFNSGTSSTSGTCTVHFPSNLSSTISGLTGYPLFGGTSGRIVLAFDLTATS